MQSVEYDISVIMEIGIDLQIRMQESRAIRNQSILYVRPLNAFPKHLRSVENAVTKTYLIIQALLLFHCLTPLRCTWETFFAEIKQRSRYPAHLSYIRPKFHTSR